MTRTETRQVRVDERGSTISTSTGEPAAVTRDGFGPDVLAWGRRVTDSVDKEHQAFDRSVFLYDPETGDLRLVAMRLVTGQDLGEVVPGEWVLPLRGSVCGWVYRAAAPALVADVRHHPEYRSFPGSTTRSELAVPILVAGRPVGVLNLEAPRVGAFNIADVERLKLRALDAAATLPATAPGAASAPPAG